MIIQHQKPELNNTFIKKPSNTHFPITNLLGKVLPSSMASKPSAINKYSLKAKNHQPKPSNLHNQETNTNPAISQTCSWLKKG